MGMSRDHPPLGIRKRWQNSSRDSEILVQRKVSNDQTALTPQDRRDMERVIAER